MWKIIYRVHWVHGRMRAGSFVRHCTISVTACYATVSLSAFFCQLTVLYYIRTTAVRFFQYYFQFFVTVRSFNWTLREVILRGFVAYSTVTQLSWFNNEYGECFVWFQAMSVFFCKIYILTHIIGTSIKKKSCP